MKPFIGLIPLAAFTAFPVAMYSAHRRTLATQTVRSKRLDRQTGSVGELVLRGMDGTAIAREVNLAPRTR
jgi:hypothetical protein